MHVHEEVNRLNWDERAELHATDQSGAYPISTVLSGGSSLNPIETKEIGDICGKDIVHLQCHIGLDTISLKNMGAKSVTGLDFSERSIARAIDFARQARADVRFVEGSVYDARKLINETFDLVYVTWGTLNWLSDIDEWARVVADLLRPDGTLYLLDNHPQLMQIEMRDDGYMLARNWKTSSDDPVELKVDKTYTGDPRLISNATTYQWLHSLGNVVNAIVSAGLRLRFLNEHETTSWKAFRSMARTSEGQYALADPSIKFPLAFSIGASKT